MIGRANVNIVFNLIFIKEAETLPNWQKFMSTFYTLIFYMCKFISISSIVKLNPKFDDTVTLAAFSLIPSAV